METCRENSSKIIVYSEDNGSAGSTLRTAGVRVKHVTLAFLPSSRDSWAIVASTLDDSKKWIHVHGNCKDSEIDAWAQEVHSKFTELLGSLACSNS